MANYLTMAKKQLFRIKQAWLAYSFINHFPWPAPFWPFIAISDQSIQLRFCEGKMTRDFPWTKGTFSNKAINGLIRSVKPQPVQSQVSNRLVHPEDRCSFGRIRNIYVFFFHSNSPYPIKELTAKTFHYHFLSLDIC